MLFQRYSDDCIIHREHLRHQHANNIHARTPRHQRRCPRRLHVSPPRSFSKNTPWYDAIHTPYLHTVFHSLLESVRACPLLISDSTADGLPAVHVQTLRHPGMWRLLCSCGLPPVRTYRSTRSYELVKKDPSLDTDYLDVFHCRFACATGLPAVRAPISLGVRYRKGRVYQGWDREAKSCQRRSKITFLAVRIHFHDFDHACMLGYAIFNSSDWQVSEYDGSVWMVIWTDYCYHGLGPTYTGVHAQRIW
jgi:hypothetical protein